MRYFKKLMGERVYLSPINPDDAERYVKWLNDKAVSGNPTIYPQMISLLSQRKKLEQMSTEGQNFAMVLAENDTLIGGISLTDIDACNRSAALGLFIGETEHRGKGYGAEAIRLILDYSFRTLNLHNIMLEVHGDNPQGVACYHKVGFKEFGRRHEAWFKDGRYVDLIYMEILDREFIEKET